MTYDIKADRFGTATSTRQSPAIEAVALTAAMVSDTLDLTTYAKALRVWNGSAAPVTLLVTPAGATSDLATAAVPITVPSGAAGYEAISVRRVWAAGSTGLASGLSAATVEVLLLTV